MPGVSNLTSAIAGKRKRELGVHVISLSQIDSSWRGNLIFAPIDRLSRYTFLTICKWQTTKFCNATAELRWDWKRTKSRKSVFSWNEVKLNKHSVIRQLCLDLIDKIFPRYNEKRMVTKSQVLLCYLWRQNNDIHLIAYVSWEVVIIVESWKLMIEKKPFINLYDSRVTGEKYYRYPRVWAIINPANSQ